MGRKSYANTWAFSRKDTSFTDLVIVIRIISCNKKCEYVTGADSLMEFRDP